MKGVFCAFILTAIQMDSVFSHTTLLIPSATVLRQEGESASLECQTNKDEFNMKWGYWPPGASQIKWLVSWSPESTNFTRLSGVETRFSESKGSKFTLRIDNLKQEDASTYYCQSGDDGDDWCGCGTTLKVKPTISPRPPSVHLHYAPPENISQQTGSTLYCVSKGFYPKNISVSWYAGGVQVSSGITYSGRLVDSNDWYTMISKLAIPTSHWVSGSYYTCIVSHEALSSPISRKINKDDGYIQEPVVHLISPPLDADTAGQTVAVTCLVSNFYPVDISVTWRDENGPLDTGVTHFGVTLGSNGTYQTVSQLTVPTAEWESNHIYWCEVKHVSLGQPTQRAVSKDLVFEAAKSSGAPGMMALLWIVAVVGGLLLLIAVVFLIHKKTTSSSRTVTANFREGLSLDTRVESTYENVYYK